MGLANNLAHTLFKQINVRLNGTLISPQTDTYHYKAYIEALLNHDRDDGESILTPVVGTTVSVYPTTEMPMN